MLISLHSILLCSSYKYTGYRERGGSSLYFYPQGTIDVPSTESEGSHVLSRFNADSLCKFTNQSHFLREGPGGEENNNFLICSFFCVNRETSKSRYPLRW